MATHKATLGKTVDGVVEYIYPKTTSDIVEYTEEMSVKEKLDELSDKAGIAYGTCSTAAATVAKVVTCEGFELSTGASIHVCFTNANSATAPTMNVNGTGAYPITWYGTTEAGTSTWRAGAVESFTYDGTSWVMSNASTADTTYYGQTKLSDSISSTSTSLAATANAVKTAYDAATAAQESADEAQAAAEEAMEAAEQNVYVHPTVTADNSTSTANPEHGSSFTTIDSVTRDTCGHVTGVNTKTVTLPEGYVYEAGTGISISSTHVINHSNSVTAGTASGSATGTLSYGGTFNMPTVTYDAQGHITGSSTTTMTMPSVSDSTSSTSSGTAASSAAVKAAMDAAATAQAAAEAAQATADAAENTAEGISYSAGTGLSLSGTTFNHSNSVTAGTASGDSSKTLTFGGTFKVPSVTYDAQGHITGSSTTTMTMPANPDTDTTYNAGTGLSLSGTTFNHSNSVTAGTASGSATGTLSYGGTFTIPTISYDAQGHITGTGTTTMTMPAATENTDTTYTAGTGISISSSNVINHSNSVTAGTASGSATGTLSYGGTFTIPSITYDAQGHITGTGTTTMTMPAEVTSVDTASKLGSSTVGSSTKPIYLSSGTATASSSTVGSGTVPMYLSSGTLTASTSTVGSSSTPVYLNAGTITACSSISATTLGSSTVGSSTKPIYLSSGTATASSSTVGSGVIPMYLSSGTMTASTSTVGSGTKPIYLSSGTLTVSSSTVGSGTVPMYLSSGTLTASTSTVGSGTKPMYLSSGTLTASSSTVGSSSAPVYLSSGTITACTGVATSSDLSSLSDTVSELSDEIDDLKENSGSPEIITSLAGCNGFYMEGDLGSVSASNVDDFVESYGLGSSTRKDVYIGCYFTASYNGNTVYFRVAAFDHDLCGYSNYGSQGKHHTVIVPDGYLESSCTMNSSGTTEGAYYGSRMYTETIPTVDERLQNIFGSHLVQHCNYLTSNVDTSMTNYNYPSYTGVVNGYTLAYYYSILMSEIEVFGRRIWSCENGYYTTLIYAPDKQLPLFWHNPKFKVCANRTANAGTTLPSTSTYSYWLRDVPSSSSFCVVSINGRPNNHNTSFSYYVRPRFALA